MPTDHDSDSGRNRHSHLEINGGPVSASIIDEANMIRKNGLIIALLMFGACLASAQTPLGHRIKALLLMRRIPTVSAMGREHDRCDP